MGLISFRPSRDLCNITSSPAITDPDPGYTVHLHFVCSPVWSKTLVCPNCLESHFAQFSLSGLSKVWNLHTTSPITSHRSKPRPSDNQLPDWDAVAAGRNNVQRLEKRKISVHISALHEADVWQLHVALGPGIILRMLAKIGCRVGGV